MGNDDDDYTVRVTQRNGKWTVRVNWENAAIGVAILICVWYVLQEAMR